MEMGKTVLLVEDNPSVLHLMERALATEDVMVLAAPNGEVALRIAGEKAGGIDLLVADLVLPGIGGLELAWRMSERDPSLGIVLVSGYACEDAALSSLAAGRVVFMEKPFSAVAFRTTVRELLGGLNG
jgi:two-component system cell cycle sensor histidine kinase/response regulator CckA